jgi:hypothetical protein
MGFENKVKGNTYVLWPMAGFGIVCVKRRGLAASVPSFVRTLALKTENFIHIFNIHITKITTLLVYNKDPNQSRVT